MRPRPIRALRRSIPRSLGFLLSRSGLLTRFVQDMAVVLAFHRVNSETAGDALTISPREFEDHCRFVRRHFDVISLGELVRRLEKGEDTGGTLVITFDDGYCDNAEVAAPILSKLGLPATFFLTTGFIGTDRVAPWDQHLPDPPGWMNWDQVLELHRAGFELGAHTVNHVDMGATPPETIRSELRDSKRTLEEFLGREVDLFAYPFGGPENITAEARALIKEAGFRCCPSCHGGVNPVRADPFKLRRVPINSWFASPSHLAGNLVLRRA